MAYEYLQSTDPDTHLVRDVDDDQMHEVSTGEAQQMYDRGMLDQSPINANAPTIPRQADPQPRADSGWGVTGLPQLGAALSRVPEAVRGLTTAAQSAPAEQAPEYANPMLAQPAAAPRVRVQGVQPTAQAPSYGAGAGVSRGSPGGWQPTTESRVGPAQAGIDEMRDADLQLRKAQIGAATEVAQLDAAKYQRESASHREGALQSQIRADAMQSDIRDKQQRIQDKAAELDRRNQAILNNRIDPARVWKDPDGPSSVLAAIAIGATQFGMGLAGQSGPNIALQMVENMIDRDVQAQLADRDRNTRALDSDRDEFHRSIEGSAQSLIDEQKLLRLKSVEQQTLAMMSDEKLAYLRPQLQATMLGIREKANQVQAQIIDRVQTTENRKYHPPVAAGVASDAARLKAKKLAADEAGYDAEIAAGGHPKGYAPVIYNGETLSWRPPEEAKIANADLRRLDNSIDTQAKIVAVLENGGITSNLSPKAVARLGVLEKQQIGNLKKEGESSDVDAQRNADRIGAKFDLSGASKTTAQTTLQELKAERNRLTKQLGSQNIQSQDQLESE